jgi:hypothetical protein
MRRVRSSLQQTAGGFCSRRMGIACSCDQFAAVGPFRGDLPPASRARHQRPAASSGCGEPCHYLPSHPGAGVPGRTGREKPIAASPSGIQLGRPVRGRAAAHIVSVSQGAPRPERVSAERRAGCCTRRPGLSAGSTKSSAPPSPFQSRARYRRAIAGGSTCRAGRGTAAPDVKSGRREGRPWRNS